LLQLLFVVPLAAVACRDSSGPTGPTPPPPAVGELTGSWVGTLTDRLHGTGSVRLLLEDRPFGPGQSFLTGAWSASFPQVDRSHGGRFAGTTAGSDVSLHLVSTSRLPCPPGFLSDLPASFLLTLQAGTPTMMGMSRYFACNEQADGRVELTKQ
jgi:hypothetical protein